MFDLVEGVVVGVVLLGIGLLGSMVFRAVRYCAFWEYES
jgi:hypothetical protein